MSKSISSYTKSELRTLLEQAQTKKQKQSVRILFIPPKLTEDNLPQAAEAYAAVLGEEFDSVIVIEESSRSLDKKLSMPSNEFFSTKFGPVSVNDKYRNEFCDEDDDFYVSDDAYSDDLALFDQLMMLQTALDEFNVVSIQMSYAERPSIIRELAYVIEELHGLRNTLVIICAELDPTHIKQFARLTEVIEHWDRSGFFNAVFEEDSHILGKGPFAAGILLGKNWELDIHLTDNNAFEKGSVLTGVAGKVSID